VLLLGAWARRHEWRPRRWGDDTPLHP
jgi:hypothetical protein